MGCQTDVVERVVVGVNRFFNFANPDPNASSNPPFNFFANPLCQDGIACMTVPLENFSGNGAPNTRYLTTFQLLDNMSYLHGAHAFKWGVNLRYQRHIDQRASIGGVAAGLAVNFDPFINNVNPVAFNFPTNIDGYDTQFSNLGGDAFNLSGFVNDLLGRVGSVQQGFVAQSPKQWAPAGTWLHADFRMPEYDFYVQDTWRLRPNFVVDLGLRWEIKLSPRVTHADNMLRPDGPLGWGFSSDNLVWKPGQLYKD